MMTKFHIVLYSSYVFFSTRILDTQAFARVSSARQDGSLAKPLQILVLDNGRYLPSVIWEHRLESINLIP